MLESKLDNQQDLNGRNHVLSQELDKVNMENMALEKKLTETEQKVEMAKNEVV